MSTTGIEKGVSLYSFNQRWVERPEYGLDETFRDLTDLGVTKFEVVGSVFFDQYPRPTTAELLAFSKAAERAGAEPFSYGGYIDWGRVTGRTPGDEDLILDLTADLMTARDLGCTYVRETNLPKHLLPLAADLAERYGVRIGVEVHAPSKPSDPRIQAQLQAFDELGSDRLGFIPDFGCFIERPAAPALAKHVASGADPELLEYIVANRHSGVSEAEMLAEVTSRGGGEAERLAIAEFFGFLSFGPADVEGFTTLLDRSLYFHSKFYYVDENLQDPTIPIDELIGEIVKSGFSGVLMSEYEGHAFHNDDAQEQLERHLLLEDRALRARTVA